MHHYIPVAFIQHINSSLIVYASRVKDSIHVAIRVLVPNDYTGTALENLHQKDEVTVFYDCYNVPDFDEISSVKEAIKSHFKFSIENGDDEERAIFGAFNTDLVYFAPSRFTTIDGINPRTGLTFYGAKTYAACKIKDDDVILTTQDDAINRMNESVIDKVARPITKKDFIKALSVLPPLDHVRRCTTESFKCSEMLTMRICAIYVKIGDDYFSFHDRASLTHEQIVQKAIEAM